MRLLDDISMALRFVTGVGRFVRRPLDPAECRRRLVEQRAERESAWLGLLEQSVFGIHDSPYRAMFAHAGIELDDVRAMVGRDGLETTLDHLYDEGIRLSLDEFKGRTSIRRGSLDLPARSRQFDNPVSGRHYEAATGGSRGTRTRIFLDFDQIADEACHLQVFLEAFDLRGRPEALTWPVPPGSAGLKNILRRAKLGVPTERWFSTYPVTWRPSQLRAAIFTRLFGITSWLVRRPQARPEHVPLSESVTVARWLEGCRRRGTPGMIAAPAGSGIRICLAARAHGLDISGSFFRLGGEPYTEGKARVVREAGCRAAPYYAMAETGLIGLPCADPMALDDVHVVDCKMAVRARPTTLPSGHTVGALHHTTLRPYSPRVMINVDSGDYATEVHRDCGCAIGEVGYRRHLHTIRSHEKLTSEGMTFIGDELLRIVEQVLPDRFGGAATDYQFVEDEAEDGTTRVSLYASPGVGEIDEGEILRTVERCLSAERGAAGMMVSVWRDAGILRVIRQEPIATGVAKILPLYVHQDGQAPSHAAGQDA